MAMNGTVTNLNKKLSFLHIRLLLKRLLLALGIYWLGRLAFIVFNWKLFSGFSVAQIAGTFLYGSIFDISAIIYFNSIFILLHLLPFPFRDKKNYQRALFILFFVVNVFTLVLNFIDTGYFRFSGKRSGIDLFTAENDIGGFWIKYVFDYWVLFTILLAILLLITKLYPKFPYKAYSKNTSVKKQITLDSLVFIVALPVLLLGVRGGWQLKPIRPFDAARFVAPGLVPVALNTPFQILMTIQGDKLPTPNYMPQTEAEKIASPVRLYQPYSENTSKPNIVIIILESFGKEYVGYFNNGKGFTPFLDSLCKQSLVFTDAYANGKRSSDAIPAIYSGLPSLMDVSYINTPYSDNRVRTLGSYLKEMGYNNSFYHGARNGSMGFENYLLLGDNGEYFGLSQYPNVDDDFDGNWGIFDEPYLQYFAKELSKKPQPFCSGVFTISSHHPYPMPKQYEGKFADGTLPIHRNLRYADYSLKKFFETAKKQSWYNNTVFILVADHSAENETPLYQNSYGKFAIPLLFFTHDKKLKGSIEKPVAQVDILPSLLQYVGYTKPLFSFGKSVFSNENKIPGIAHNDGGIYQYIKDSFVVHFNGNELVAVFNKKQDPFLTQNLLDKLPQQPQLEKELKALLQVYFSRLNQNNFIAKPN